MKTAILWSIVGLQALATMWFVSVVTPVVTTFAGLLLLVAVVGFACRAALGRKAAVVFSWMAMALSFALVVPDYEIREFSGVEAILGRSASTFELYAAVAVAVAPWLACIHVLALQKQWFSRHSGSQVQQTAQIVARCARTI